MIDVSSINDGRRLTATGNDNDRRPCEIPDFVRYHVRASSLQPAEKTILSLLEPELAEMNMLDLGVGAGRTTQHFAPRVERYVALDRSLMMLRAWCKRFTGTPYEFIRGHVRKLPFKEHSFDFVLFSDNGIDYVGREDRPRALAEIRRVTRPGGVFVFSTHDLALASRARASEEPLRCAGHGVRRERVRATKPSHERLSYRPSSTVDNGVLDFLTARYHLHFSEQLAELHGAGFEHVRAYSGTSGAEIVSLALERVLDPWLYLLCRVA